MCPDIADFCFYRPVVLISKDFLKICENVYSHKLEKSIIQYAKYVINSVRKFIKKTVDRYSKKIFTAYS